MFGRKNKTDAVGELTLALHRLTESHVKMATAVANALAEQSRATRLLGDVVVARADEQYARMQLHAEADIELAASRAAEERKYRTVVSGSPNGAGRMTESVVEARFGDSGSDPLGSDPG